MNWKAIEHYEAPMLDEFPISTPESFYRSFAIVFGSILRKEEAFSFIERINQMMAEKKGGGRLKKESILKARNEGCDISEFVFYDNHHVTPSSRDDRPSIYRYDQVVELPKKFHAAWHVLFLNLYGREILIFLERLFYILRRDDEFEYYKFNQHVKRVKEGRLSRV